MSTHEARASVKLATMLLLVVACGGDDEPGPEPGGAVPVAEVDPQAPADGAAAAWPDTTAEAVQRYLRDQDYRRAWAMWPGKAALYAGGEPHGALLTTYVNAVARDALAGDADRMPYRAVVVKENYAPDSTLAATTVMYKVEGYDAAHGDWWWAKYLPDGAVEAAGRVDGCIGCHGARSGNDYLMTGTLDSGGTEPPR